MGDIEQDIVVLSNQPNVLNTCVNQTSRGRGKTRPYPLSELNDLKIQQGLIIKDLLFSLIGYEGCYIRYSEKYDPSEINSKIRGPDFKIAKHLDISLKCITKKLVKFGKYYSGLNGFLELYDRPEFGKVVQRLCFAISEFLIDYQQIIKQIEDEFKFNSTFNLSIFETILNQELSLKLSHFYDIVISVHTETIERSKYKHQTSESYFNNFIKSIQNDLKETGTIDLATDNVNFEFCKGGILLKIIQDRINAYQGDIISLEFLTKIFDVVSIDYVSMLNKWLINGEIDDSAEEFIIKMNRFPDNPDNPIRRNVEKYWDELYVTRTDGVIDQFSSKDIQLKILATGKYLNIFKACTGLYDFQQLNEIIQPIDRLYSQDLELKIHEYYKRANKLLMKLLFEGYQFPSLIDGFQRLFLFKDSSKIDVFLEKSFNDLRKNKHAISTSRLTKLYDDTLQRKKDEFQVKDINKQNSISDNKMNDVLSYCLGLSIDFTNFYDLAEEILNVKSFDAEEAFKNGQNSNIFKALINNSLERDQMNSAGSNSSPNSYDPDHSDEYTISGVNIDMDLPFPLNMIVGQNYVLEYQLIFKLQMIVKFINKLIDHTWKEINYSTVWKYSGFHPKIRKWILRCRILNNRMKDFMNDLQFYLNFDIIETNFDSFRQHFKDIQNLLHKEKLGSNIDHQNTNNGGIIGFKNGSLANYNHNNLFDEKILNHNQNFNDVPNDNLINIDNLISKLGSFLNNILRDSFITNKVLIDVLKNMFDLIILYNHYLNRLKKSLIMSNKDLFHKFSQDYPEKFQNRVMDDELIETRFKNLDGMLNSHFEIFNDSLTEFIVTLKSHGNLENQLFLILIERLEHCFPDH